MSSGLHTSGCTTPVCVANDHLPCALQHANIVFSQKEHSRVRLFKDDIVSGKRRYVFVKTSWVLLQTTYHPCVSGCGRCLALGDGHDRCFTCLSSKHAEVAFVDESSSHCGCSSRSCGQAPLPRQRGGAVASVSI